MAYGIRKRLLGGLIGTAFSAVLIVSASFHGGMLAGSGVGAGTGAGNLPVMDGPGPIRIANGMAQPVLEVTDPYPEDYTNQGSDIQRFVVYVETDHDTDLDGKADLVKTVVQVPIQAVEGEYKAPVIFEGDPYYCGYDLCDYEHRTDEALDEKTLYNNPAKRVQAGTTTSKDLAETADPHDWSFHLMYPGTEEEVPYDFMFCLDYYDDFLSRGFAVVLSSGLGTYGSEGLECCGSRLEMEAFKCIVEWLHGDRTAFSDTEHNIAIPADWSNGKVGMTGISYSSAIAYEVADSGVPGLEAIAVSVGPYSWYDFACSQGYQMNGNEYGYLGCLSSFCSSRFYTGEYDETILPVYERYLKYIFDESNKLRGSYGDIWASRDFYSTPTNCKAAVLLTQGLNDTNVHPKTWDLGRTRLKKAGCQVKSILHQNGHTDPISAHSSDDKIYEGYSYQELRYIWFTHYLLGVDNQVDLIPDMMWQSNLTGEYQKVEEWDTGENIKITPDRTDKEVVSAKDSFMTNKEIYDKIFTGKNTPGSVYWSYDIKEPTTINGKIPVHLRVKTDFTGDYDLPMALYLVDYCDSPFEAYLPRFASQTDWETDNENEEEEEPVKHRSTTNRKTITRGVINLCNPNADYEPTTAIRPEEPIKAGEYYDYTVYLQPTYYTFQAGHKLELYITAFGDTFLEHTDPAAVKDQDYTKLTTDFSFTIDNEASYCLLPVTSGEF